MYQQFSFFSGNAHLFDSRHLLLSKMIFLSSTKWTNNLRGGWIGESVTNFNYTASPYTMISYGCIFPQILLKFSEDTFTFSKKSFEKLSPLLRDLQIKTMAPSRAEMSLNPLRKIWLALQLSQNEYDNFTLISGSLTFKNTAQIILITGYSLIIKTKPSNFGHEMNKTQSHEFISSPSKRGEIFKWLNKVDLLWQNVLWIKPIKKIYSCFIQNGIFGRVFTNLYPTLERRGLHLHPSPHLQIIRENLGLRL